MSSPLNCHNLMEKRPNILPSQPIQKQSSGSSLSSVGSSVGSNQCTTTTTVKTPLPPPPSTPSAPHAPQKYPVKLNRKSNNFVCYSTPGTHVSNLVDTTPSFQTNRLSQHHRRSSSTGADRRSSIEVQAGSITLPFSPIFNKDGEMRPVPAAISSPVRGVVFKRRRSSSMSRLGTSSSDDKGGSSEGDFLDHASSIGSFPMSLTSQRSSKSLTDFGEIPSFDELFSHQKLPKKPNLPRSQGSRNVFEAPLSSISPSPIHTEPSVGAPPSPNPLRMKKPTRPLSAYNFYFKQERERMARAKKEGGRGGPKIGFSAMGKQIGKSWKLITETEKKPLVELALLDKKRYDIEMIKWRALSLKVDVKKSKINTSPITMSTTTSSTSSLPSQTYPWTRKTPSNRPASAPPIPKQVDDSTLTLFGKSFRRVSESPDTKGLELGNMNLE